MMVEDVVVRHHLPEWQLVMSVGVWNTLLEIAHKGRQKDVTHVEAHGIRLMVARV